MRFADRLRDLLPLRTSSDPSYLQRFAIEPELLASTERAQDPVAGKLLSWQKGLPEYPRGNYRGFVTKGWRRSIPFRRCVEMLYNAFNQGRVAVENRDGARLEGARAGELHPLVQLFRGGATTTPRPGLTEKLLWTRFVQDAYHFGNAYWEKVYSIDGKRVLELWRLDPERIAVVPDEVKFISRYLYNAGGKWWPIEPERMIHWLFPDPLQPYFGIPPIFTAFRDVSVDSKLIDHLQVTLQNYAVPATILRKTRGKLRPGEAEEAAETFKARVKGGKDIAVIGANTEVQVVGMDFSEMAIGDLTSTSEARIAQAHGVPSILLGRSGTQGDPTRANYREAKEHFWMDTIINLHDVVGDLLTAHLLIDFTDDPDRVVFDTDHVPILQEARLRRAEQSTKIFLGGLVSRHVGQRLAGLEQTGPDVFYRPISVDAVITADAEAETIELDDL